MRPIDADGLVLEPQTTAHAPEMFEVLADPAIYEFENEPPPSVEWLRVRFALLEARQSPDARELWLNWVIRLPTSELIGYVQATVYARRGGGKRHAAIAYELSSSHWGRGLATRAVRAMMRELVERHRVRSFGAVLKRKNMRSFRLLQRLGFQPASPQYRAAHPIEDDEIQMRRGIDGLF